MGNRILVTILLQVSHGVTDSIAFKIYIIFYKKIVMHMFSMYQCSAGGWRQTLTKIKLFLTYYSVLFVEASFCNPPSLPGYTDICNLACSIRKMNSFAALLLISGYLCSWVCCLILANDNTMPLHCCLKEKNLSIIPNSSSIALTYDTCHHTCCK